MLVKIKYQILKSLNNWSKLENRNKNKMRNNILFNIKNKELRITNKESNKL